jgi:gamma-glutamylaminecyclotransferase
MRFLLERAMEAEPIYTFLYGTLQSGEPNHHVLVDARFVKLARTLPMFELVDLGEYPALLEGGHVCVEGEVWEISRETISLLDQFEGVPNLYRRSIIALEDGTRAEAYVWASGRLEDRPRIAGGSWKETCSLRRPKTARPSRAEEL